MFEIIKKLFSTAAPVNLEELIHKGALLVDVRSNSEYFDEHVKGSVNIPLDHIQKQLAKFLDKEHIVVFCRSGNRSARAKSILNRHGITNVTNGGSWESVNKIVKIKLHNHEKKHGFNG